MNAFLTVKRFPKPKLLAFAAALPVLIGDASAQPETPTSRTPIELSSSPFELNSLGARFSLPLGATATTRRIGTEIQADIVGPNASYRVSITSRSSANTDLTSEAAAESILLNLKNAFGVADGDSDDAVTIATFAQELRTVEPVAFSGGLAHRFFIRQPATRDEGDTVRGVAVVNLGRGRMLVWDATAPSDHFETLAPSLDAMLGTLLFDAADRRQADRGIAIEAGRRVFEQFGSEQVRRTFEDAQEQWFRLYQPSADGDTEIGYRRVTAWTGARGEVSPEARATTDLTPGYLVRIEARTIGEINPTTGNQVLYDSRGTYWVSEDLSSETWQLAIAIRDGRRTTTLSEVGARDGDEELIVTSQTPNGRAESIRHRLEGDGYLSQPMALMLPQLLATSETAADFGFYVYRSDTSAIAYRSDSLRRDDSSEGWVLKSRVAPGTPELIKFLHEDGTIRREQLPDGKVWDPIGSDELVNLWRRKGLPLK